MKTRQQIQEGLFIDKLLIQPLIILTLCNIKYIKNKIKCNILIYLQKDKSFLSRFVAKSKNQIKSKSNLSYESHLSKSKNFKNLDHTGFSLEYSTLINYTKLIIHIFQAVYFMI